MPLPRQAYGNDFYGHEKGEILVAVDLCTREATLWFLPNRKQDNVARALMTGLILQKLCNESLSCHQPSNNSLSQPAIKRSSRALYATSQWVSHKMRRHPV
jgi:hypothetical protein